MSHTKILTTRDAAINKVNENLIRKEKFSTMLDVTSNAHLFLDVFHGVLQLGDELERV